MGTVSIVLLLEVHPRVQGGHCQHKDHKSMKLCSVNFLDDEARQIGKTLMPAYQDIQKSVAIQLVVLSLLRWSLSESS